MTDPKIYANTYWCRKGNHQSTADKLQLLIPASESVPKGTRKNRNLETLRQFVNVYYDLYNNGLCNLSDEFEELFGFEAPEYDEDWEPEFVARVEHTMDAVILAAAREQGVKYQSRVFHRFFKKDLTRNRTRSNLKLRRTK